jgi:hypothetical protein
MVTLTGCALLAATGVLLGVVAAISRDRVLRVGAVIGLLGGYSALLALWLVAQIGHLFLPRETEYELRDLAFWLAPFYLLGIIGWAIWSPRHSWKIWTAVLGLALGILVFNFSCPFTAYSDRLYVRRNQEALSSLVADVIAYERIRSMDPHYMRALNGTFVLYQVEKADSPSHLKRVPLAAVLARDGIEPAKYADFERRLSVLHLMAFWVDSGQVTLARSRGGGSLYRPQDPPLKPGAPLGNSGRILRVLADGWYWYSSVN